MTEIEVGDKIVHRLGGSTYEIVFKTWDSAVGGYHYTGKRELDGLILGMKRNDIVDIIKE